MFEWLIFKITENCDYFFKWIFGYIRSFTKTKKVKAPQDVLGHSSNFKSSRLKIKVLPKIKITSRKK